MSDFSRININNVGGDNATGQLADHNSGAFQRIDANVGVAAALEAEGSVSFQTVTLGCFADADRVEVGTLQKQSLGIVGDTRVEATINTADA